MFVNLLKNITDRVKIRSVPKDDLDWLFSIITKFSGLIRVVIWNKDTSATRHADLSINTGDSLYTEGVFLGAKGDIDPSKYTGYLDFRGGGVLNPVFLLLYVGSEFLKILPGSSSITSLYKIILKNILVIEDAGQNKVFSIGDEGAIVKSLWQLIIENHLTSNSVSINRTPTFQKILAFKNNNIDRFRNLVTPESGGANYFAQRFDDAGNLIGNYQSVNRLNGSVTWEANNIGFSHNIQNNGSSFTRQGLNIVAGNANGQTQYLRFSTITGSGAADFSFDNLTNQVSLNKKFQATAIVSNFIDNGIGGSYPMNFQQAGTTVASYTSSRWSFELPIKKKVYTLLTLPAAVVSQMADEGFCSNLTGGAEGVFFDSTTSTWKRCSDKTDVN